MGLLAWPGGAAWAWCDSNVAQTVFLVGVAAIALVRGRRRDLLVALTAVALTDVIASRVLKPSFGRERPCVVDAQVRAAQEVVDVTCRSGASLPSSHASNSAAAAAAFLSPPLAVASAVIGASRVVDGQHYPSDVVAGWLLGGLVGAGVRRAAGRVWPRDTSPPP